MQTMYIGIDIGGTNIRVGGSESLDEPKLVGRLSFPNDPNYTQNERRIIEAVRKLGPDLSGIGVSTMGRLDEAKTKVLSASAAPQWVNQPLAATLRDAFGCPTVLNGDQYCAALSEAITQKLGSDFVCVVWGTGIGASIVEYADGKPTVRTIEYDKHLHYLRPWQLDCGGKWVRDLYGKPLEDLPETEWASVMDDFYDHLVTFIHELQPARLVFGGGVAVKQWPRLQIAFDRLR